MVNLGVAANSIGVRDPFNRSALEDNKVRSILVVKEEGKLATQFVSTSSSLRWAGSVCPFHTLKFRLFRPHGYLSFC